MIKWAAEEVGKSKRVILPRQAENQLPNPKGDVQLTSAEQQRVDEHKWIEIEKTRKTNRNNLVSEEPAPVQCSNEYDALKDATISSDTQEESDTEVKERLPLSQEVNQVATPKKRQHKKANRNARRLQKKMERLKLSAEEENFFTECIERAEEERTQEALQDNQNIWRRAEEQHTQRPNIKPSISRAPAEKLAIEHETSLEAL